MHKGILLGTGPLVDPGFGGRILIPLHNLTDNNYSLRGGDGIIWVEFTKVSENPYWKSNREVTARPSGLVEFPNRKVVDNPDAYLNKSRASVGVQSAFRGALEKANQAAEDSQAAAEAVSERAEETDKRLRTFGYLGLIAVAVGLTALVFSAYNISGQVADRVHRQGQRLHELEKMVEDLKENSNASGVAEEPEDPESPDPGVAEPASPEEETELKGDDQFADARRTLPVTEESPTPGVR